MKVRIDWKQYDEFASLLFIETWDAVKKVHPEKDELQLLATTTALLHGGCVVIEDDGKVTRDGPEEETES